MHEQRIWNGAACAGMWERRPAASPRALKDLQHEALCRKLAAGRRSHAICPYYDCSGYRSGTIDQRLEFSIQRQALVEDKAAALIALSAHLLEVPKDAAVQLQHVVHA